MKTILPKKKSTKQSNCLTKKTIQEISHKNMFNH